MEEEGSSALDVNGIWGRLAVALHLENQDKDTRKWLKLVWRNDRRKVRSMFYASKISEIQSLSNGDEKTNGIQSTLTIKKLVASYPRKTEKSKVRFDQKHSAKVIDNIFIIIQR